MNFVLHLCITVLLFWSKTVAICLVVIVFLCLDIWISYSLLPCKCRYIDTNPILIDVCGKPVACVTFLFEIDGCKAYNFVNFDFHIGHIFSLYNMMRSVYHDPFIMQLRKIAEQNMIIDSLNVTMEKRRSR